MNENIFIDKLTRLFNRYYLDRVLGDLKSKKKIAVMMMDMNDFKRINDDLGHSQGDDALFTMAEILRETVGSLGTAVRYAGDEFVVVLNTDSESVAESCQNRIKENLANFNNSFLVCPSLNSTSILGSPLVSMTVTVPCPKR